VLPKLRKGLLESYGCRVALVRRCGGQGVTGPLSLPLGNTPSNWFRHLASLRHSSIDPVIRLMAGFDDVPFASLAPIPGGSGAGEALDASLASAPPQKRRRTQAPTPTSGPYVVVVILAAADGRWSGSASAGPVANALATAEDSVGVADWASAMSDAAGADMPRIVGVALSRTWTRLHDGTRCEDAMSLEERQAAAMETTLRFERDSRSTVGFVHYVWEQTAFLTEPIAVAVHRERRLV
jgi:hypothetical protein